MGEERTIDWGRADWGRTAPRSHWDRFYGTAPERLPRAPSDFALAHAPGLGARLAAAGLPGRLLELGPGLGDDARAFASGGALVVALDITPEGMRAGGIDRAPGIDCLVSDLRGSLPFAPGAFGACFSRLVLSCDFSGPQVDACLGEILRVLAPGGMLLLEVRSTADETYQRLGTPGAGPLQCGGVGLHFFSRRSLRAHLAPFEAVALADGPGTLRALAQRPRLDPCASGGVQP